jgi:hypothetical protein
VEFSQKSSGTCSDAQFGEDSLRSPSASTIIALASEIYGLDSAFFFFPVIIWLRGSLYKEKKSDRKPPLRHMKLVRPETYRRFSERHT